MKRFILTAVILSCCALAQAQTLNDPNLKLTTYITGLSQPTQMRFLGPDDLLVTEKATGRVFRYNHGVKTTVLDLNVASDSERGLLGFTLDPNFATNKKVYAYYSLSATTDGGAWKENRLSSFTFNGTSLTQEHLIQTFSTPNDGQSSNGPNHDGGPIIFGPDGKLYGALGDLNRSRAEQNNQSAGGSTSRVGGIYRLNADGTVPTDNPFVGLSNAAFHQWYAYGVRNSFGLAFDPVTGNFWDTENGPDAYDEINLVPKGFNSGWTKIMGPDSRDTNSVSDLVRFTGSVYSDPEFSFFNPIGITSLSFLAGTKLDADYHDAVIFGDVNFGNLYILRLNAARDGFVTSGALSDLVADNTNERNSLLFGQGFGITTDIEVGPDNAIYIASLSQGTIFRLSTAAPEPAAIALLLSGVGGLVAIRRRTRTA